PRDADDLRNLAQLRRHLPERWQALGGDQTEIVGRRVGFRWQARDYLPVVGTLPGAQNRGNAQVLVNLGHGSRGISGTPICAELLADQLCGLPLPTDTRIISALAPMRFEGLTRSPGQPR
ncbi:MAG: FAD-dependent oxidoreductase, partial [Wenzhouxiangellaceae bacterium]